MRDGLNLVTGASGFVGSHVVRKLVAAQEPVRVLVRPESSLKNLEGLDIEICAGDLNDPASLRKALQGCRFLYHVAADYRLWVADPSVLYRTNVQGTRNILEAARASGVKRVVYTSTVGALAISGNGTPSNEKTPVSLRDMIGHYKRSKFLAEAEALYAAKQGVPVVIVNPSTPVGSYDVKPTPTGQVILDFLNGRMPAYVETGLNLIDVEDVAEGHLLAMEKGRVGERYILGYKNVTLREMLEILGRLTHRKPPGLRLPHSVAMGLAAVSTSMSFITKRPPWIPLEAVRMSKKKMFFDSNKAVSELNLPQNSIEEALRKAVRWFEANGYIR